MRFRTHLTRPALVGALLLTAVAACAGDRILTPTFGAACERGTLRPGRTVLGILNEDSCADAYNFYSGTRSAYESHRLDVNAGQAYFVRMSPRPDPDRNGRDGLSPVLAVFARGDGGTSAPRSVSDESDGDDRDAELFFVAPKRETLQVVTSSFDAITEYDYLGGYRLTVETCPVLGAVADTGTTTFTLQPSRCVRGTTSRVEYQGDTIAYNFITIKANPWETLRITANGSDFTPAMEMFGPRGDTYGRLTNDAQYDRIIGEGTRAFNFYADGGTLTVAIAASRITGPSRQFTLRVTRAPVSPN